MEYNRKQKSLTPIDILKFETVETGAVFKQYDINTSILELELVANGEPVHLTDSERVYVTVKASNQLSTQLLLEKYSGASKKKSDLDNYKILLEARKRRTRDINNLIDVYISPLALSQSGDMVAEVIIVDLIKEQRITSQGFKFKIEPSITPNKAGESVYKIVEDLDGTYITDSEEVQLLVAEVVPNFKLAFTGEEVNKILTKANDFDVEANSNAIESLQEKDSSLEGEIQNLKSKDSNIDREIENLKSKDSSLDGEISQLKQKDSLLDNEISQLKQKDLSLDSEIQQLKDEDNSIKQDIESKVEKLNKQNQDANSEIMKLKAQDISLGEEIKTNKGLIDVLSPKVSSLEGDNQNNKNNISVLEGKVNTANSNISDLQQSNSSLGERVGQVEGSNASIDKIVKQLQQDVESYKSSIDLLKSKVPVWKDFSGESFKVENSFYGKSRYLSIKGRTLQNIFPSEATKLSISSGSISNGLITINAQSNTYGNMWDVKNPLYKTNTKYSVIIDILENTLVKMETTPPNQDYLFIGKSGNQNDSVFSGARSLIIGDGSKGRYVVPLETVSDFSTMTNNYGARIFLSNVFTRGQLKLKIMILEGDWTNKSIPQYFEGVKSFGQKENKISILSHGENLLDIKNITNGGSDINTTVQNDKVIITSLDNSRNWMSSYIVYYLKANTDYSFKYNAIGNGFIRANIRDFYDDSITYTNDIAPDYFRTFRVSKDVKVRIRFYITGSTGGSFKNEYYNIQLKEGSQDTLYKPYQQDKKDILLSEYGFDEGLRGLPSVQDELNKVKGISIKRVGKSLIDETMEFYIETQNDTHISFYTEIKGMKPDDLYTDVKAQRNSLSSNMPWIKRAWDVTDKDSIGLEGYAVSNANSRLYIRVKKSSLSSPTVESFKELVRTWKENGIPFILYYELINPIETPLNKDINFDTLDDITYVSLENNIKNDISCQCQVSLASTEKQ